MVATKVTDALTRYRVYAETQNKTGVEALQRADALAHDVPSLAHQVQDLRRRINAALGLIKQMDAFDDGERNAGRVAVFMIDLRTVLTACRDEELT